MTIPGWYPDPDGSRRLRYWDGDRWTDHTAVPAETSLGPAPLGPAPGARPPTGPAGPGPGPGPGPSVEAVWAPRLPPPPRPVWQHGYQALPELGSWLSRTFETVRARLRTLAVLCAVAMAPAFLVDVLALIATITGDVRIDDGVITDDGTGALLEILSLLSSILTTLGSIVLAASTAHLVRAHLRGHGWERSLAWGFHKALRVLGWSLLLALALVGMLVVALIPAAAAPVLLVLTIPVAVVAAIWISVRLLFVQQVAALAPPGESVFRTAWRLSEDRFWGLLGRVLLLSLIVIVGVVVVALVQSIALVAGSPVAVAALAPLVLVAGALGSAVISIGMVLLYAWVDGPVDPAADAA